MDSGDGCGRGEFVDYVGDSEELRLAARVHPGRVSPQAWLMCDGAK